MVRLSNELGFMTSENFQYISNYHSNLYLGMIQAAIHMVVVIVSILKPWGKRPNKYNEFVGGENK